MSISHKLAIVYFVWTVLFAQLIWYGIERHYSHEFIFIMSGCIVVNWVSWYIISGKGKPKQ